jgi:hypothetical protein
MACFPSVRDCHPDEKFPRVELRPRLLLRRLLRLRFLLLFLDGILMARPFSIYEVLAYVDDVFI